MFWGCFSYDKKGPCHIWKAETAAQKKAAQKELDKINNEKEAEHKAEWEITTGMRRHNLRRIPGGKKPQWKYTKQTGKLVRDGKGGIDWYRYQKVSINCIQ